MHSGRTLNRTVLAIVPAALAILSAAAAAQSPYVINGLHSELILSEALAQAQTLGGDCQVIPGHPSEEGKVIQCEYAHCDETDPAAAQADSCDPADPNASGPSFARQPIATIVLQAPADTARLTRIVMIYSGATDTLAAGLIEAFGPTEADGAPSDAASWSHARRWSWRAGPYRMGLMNSPQWITLATDRVPAEPAGDGAVDTPP
jgi:hypothetical protein